MTNAETIKYFSEYILKDSELARQLVNANDLTKDTLMLWVFCDKLGTHPTSRAIVTLYNRKIMGADIPDSDWDAAIADAQRVAESLREKTFSSEAAAAWAAAEPKNLAGVAQSAGVALMAAVGNNQMKMVTASELFNTEFKAKVVELLS